MNILVLSGGVSTEREVSLRTSTKVATALTENGHKVAMIDVFFGEEKPLEFGTDTDFSGKADKLRQKNDLITEELIKKTGVMGPNVLETCKKADIVFIGLHGENGEDGKVQAELDKAGVKYTGSGPEASALAMDKSKTKEVVSPFVKMPKGITLRKGEAFDEKVPAPCIVKPCNGGSSVGVVIVNKEEDYEKAIEEVFKYDDTILVEEFVKGRELTQAVIDGKAYPPVEIMPDEDKWYDYTNKYNGETKEVCPAPISDDVLKRMSESSITFGEKLGLSVYYRIDYLLKEDGSLYALEANSLPGMTNTSLVPQEALAMGISYNQLCELIINKSLEKYN